MEKRALVDIILFLLLLLVGCGEKGDVGRSNPALGSQLQNRLIVSTSDYLSKGSVTVVDLATGKTQRNVIPTHSDAVVRAPAGPWAYVINRLGADNIHKIAKDGSKSFPECKVGTQSNPQDVEVIGDSLYVSRFAKTSELLVLNPDTCDTKPGPDLSRFADADGSPEMGHLFRQQKKLYVELRRLNTKAPLFPPAGNGSVVEIDLESRAITNIPLPCANPVTDFKLGPEGHLYLGCAGRVVSPPSLDGAIVKIDPATRVVETVIHETALGGDIYDIEILRPDLGVAIIKTGSWDKLVTFNPQSKRLGQDAIARADSWTLEQLVRDVARNFLYVVHRDRTRPGIRIFDLESVRERPESFLDVGLPATWMELTD